MASEEGRIQLMLALFLMTVAIFVLAGLSTDLYRKNEVLKLDVQRLENSQVLLMVPDEQAELIANWLEQHPAQTQSLINMVAQKQPQVGETKTVTKVQAASEVPKNTSGNTLESESEDGVKVIKLPHGGIRVTTRDEADVKP